MIFAVLMALLGLGVAIFGATSLTRLRRRRRAWRKDVAQVVDYKDTLSRGRNGVRTTRYPVMQYVDDRGQVHTRTGTTGTGGLRGKRLPYGTDVLVDPQDPSHFVQDGWGALGSNVAFLVCGTLVFVVGVAIGIAMY